MGAVFLGLSGLPDCVWLFKSIHLIVKKLENTLLRWTCIQSPYRSTGNDGKVKDKTAQEPNGPSNRKGHAHEEVGYYLRIEAHSQPESFPHR